MRTATAAPVTSLLGSLGLHGGIVLAMLIAAQRAPMPAPVAPVHADAWQGNAVEVDAVATPEATPNIENTASAPAESEPSAPAEPAKPSEPTPAVEPKAAPAEQAVEPAPKPRPKRPRRAASPSAADGAAAAPTSGSHESNTAAATGAFGSEGLPPGVRSLPSAFTRAIPPATGADPLWQSLAAGTQRPFILSVRVDADGHISEARLVDAHDGQGAPPQFEHLRDRVIALLGGGLFALQNNSVAGTDLFRITITLSDRAVQEGSGPAELVERGFEPPRIGAPGRAYFTLASGRHFEAKVEILGSPKRP